MITFLTLIAIPLILAGLSFVVSKGITWQEFLLQVGAQCVFAAMCTGYVYHQNVSDDEILNGRITSKKRERVSCEHRYDCNCRMVSSGTGKNRTTRRVCDTCHEHSYDVSWRLYGSTGSRWTVSRVDRQGTSEPGRWTSARIGDPTAETNSYTNYIKAAPDSLFRHQGLTEKYQGKLPQHPEDIYNIHYLNRLVLAGARVPEANEWNADLMELNADLGAAKQVNIQVVITPYPQDYFFALEEQWVGGKKNDVTAVLSVDSSGQIKWAHVMAWSTNKMFEVVLRDDIVKIGELNRSKVMAALRANVSKYYKRKPMRDFEYLQASIVPSTGEYVVCTILGVLLALGLAYWVHHEDVFGTEVRHHRVW
jgi:hypothetical protein